MKVQWRLINVENNEMISALGDQFDLDLCKLKDEMERLNHSIAESARLIHIFKDIISEE